MSANQVYVKNISPETSEKEIKEFFSFCGKISSLELKKEGTTQEASVTFEKETAAKTALLLDATRLGSNEVKVESAAAHASEEDYTHAPNDDSEDIAQEDKPRSRIVAEYLAHGYVIGDTAIQRAINLDEKHGVSSRFLATLQNLDSKYHATDKAKSVDQSYGVTPKVNSILQGLNSYYEKAAGTPTGKKLVNFYTQGQRQVVDIHTEARRLADLKKKEAAGGEKTACKCDSSSASCSCQPGTCGCPKCAKSDVKTVPGTDKTNCSCGGKEAECKCAPKHCACTSCPKSDVSQVEGSTKTKCSCGGNEGKCGCPEGKCACTDCAK